MEQQPVVTAVALSPSVSTMEVSTPARQPAVAEQREEPKAQAFAAEAPVPVAAPIVAPEPHVVQAVVAPVEKPVPAASMRAPQADPKELLSNSGLVMIETDPSRSKSYQLEEERVQVGRPRRERPKPSAPDELMQVETKN